MNFANARRPDSYRPLGSQFPSTKSPGRGGADPSYNSDPLTFLRDLVSQSVFLLSPTHPQSWKKLGPSNLSLYRFPLSSFKDLLLRFTELCHPSLRLRRGRGDCHSIGHRAKGSNGFPGRGVEANSSSFSCDVLETAGIAQGPPTQRCARVMPFLYKRKTVGITLLAFAENNLKTSDQPNMPIAGNIKFYGYKAGSEGWAWHKSFSLGLWSSLHSELRFTLPNKQANFNTPRNPPLARSHCPSVLHAISVFISSKLKRVWFNFFFLVHLVKALRRWENLEGGNRKGEMV